MAPPSKLPSRSGPATSSRQFGWRGGQVARPALDFASRAFDLSAMDADDSLPRRSNDPLPLLVAQDLAPLSVEECEARIAALEAEVERTRVHLQRAVNHRATADALFRR